MVTHVHVPLLRQGRTAHGSLSAEDNIKRSIKFPENVIKHSRHNTHVHTLPSISILVYISCACACVCAIDGQTAGPIITKSGMDMRIDLGMVPT